MTKSHNNRLSNETSTYLLQHAHNPVDWYPWSSEALTRSQSEDKPIFLSIGYAACHWCHVMEHESFMDDSVAKLLNDNFVCIKVDREERTDLDEIYMKAVQLMSGHGGWPMTVFLTPALKPFFGGTYFPPDDKHGLPSFRRLLNGVIQTWQTKRKEIEESAQGITNHLIAMEELGTSNEVDSHVTKLPDENGLVEIAQKLFNSFDQLWGGFGNAPKFPHTFSLSLAMRCASHLCQDIPSLKRSFTEMISQSLNRMAYGGIHDQIGGGFARYSVDRQWLVPHFEKMLYDNALLCCSYFDGYLLTGNDYWKKVADGILQFVRRDLAAGNGAFYSSLDADSEGVEGKFYVWTKAEIENVLGPDEASFICQVFGVTQNGNFEHGTNILHLVESPDSLASQHQLSLAKFWAKLAPLSAKLLTERAKRVPPIIDEKVLTNWNSLIASAFIRGFEVTGNNSYLDTAKSIANFILENMYVNGRLLHTWGKGRAKLNGYLDDYAYFTQTLLDLAGVDDDPTWLTKAIQLSKYLLEHFSDSQSAQLYYTSDDHETLVTRPKNHFDGSVPSATSVAVFNLLRLARITANDEFRRTAEGILTSYAPFFAKIPDQFANLLCALDFSLSRSPDIVLTINNSSSGKDLLSQIFSQYIPNKVVVVKRVNEETKKIAEDEPALLSQKGLVNNNPAVFICQDFTCAAPVTDVSALKQLFASFK